MDAIVLECGCLGQLLGGRRLVPRPLPWCAAGGEELAPAPKLTTLCLTAPEFTQDPFKETTPQDQAADSSAGHELSQGSNRDSGQQG